MVTSSGRPCTVDLSPAAGLSPGAAGLDRLRRALERAEREFVADVVADGGIEPWRRRIEGRFRTARDALTASPTGGAGPPAGAGLGVSLVESAALLVALVDRPVRDGVWRQLDADPDRRWLALWRHLARHALPPYRTEPLFLLAWTAWRSGDPATARLAVDCAREQDPGHRASVLLGRMLSTGTDPHRLPSLAAAPSRAVR